MAIPDYQALTLPLLKKLADGEEHKHSNLIDELGSEFGLTEEELSKPLPSGTQKLFTNRVGWTRTYLKNAGLLDSPKRGFQQITDRGRTVLSQNPGRIDNKFLEQFPEFIAPLKKVVPVQITMPSGVLMSFFTVYCNNPVRWSKFALRKSGTRELRTLPLRQ